MISWYVAHILLLLLLILYYCEIHNYAERRKCSRQW